MRRFLWVGVFALVFVLALSNFLLYEHALRGSLDKLRNKLKAIASSASLNIDADMLLKIPLKLEGDKTQEYKIIYEKLSRIKEVNPSVKYIYIMTTTERSGILQYVVDANPLPEIVTSKSPTAFSGDKYDARLIPEMLNAYKGPTADAKFFVDEWGATISGYAPIRDNSGKAVAILGVDMDVTPLYASQKMSPTLLYIVLISGIFFLVSILFLCLRAINVSP